MSTLEPCLLNFCASFKSPLKKSTKTAFANSQILLRNMRYWDIVERKGRDFNLRYAKKWKQYLNVDSVVKRSKICYLINWILQNYLYDEKEYFLFATRFFTAYISKVLKLNMDYFGGRVLVTWSFSVGVGWDGFL